MSTTQVSVKQLAVYAVKGPVIIQDTQDATPTAKGPTYLHREKETKTTQSFNLDLNKILLEYCA